MLQYHNKVAESPVLSRSGTLFKHIDMAEGRVIFSRRLKMVVVERYSLVNAIIDFKNAVYFNEVRFLFNSRLAI